MLTAERLSQSRLASWYNLRQQLETDPDPLNTVVKYFLNKPRVKFYTDPYDSSTWPTAWELIDENEFCEFNIILSVCYTLQLTERFKDVEPTINVAFDKINKTVYYLLFFGDKVYGYLEEEWTDISSLPKSLQMQKIYAMRKLH